MKTKNARRHLAAGRYVNAVVTLKRENNLPLWEAKRLVDVWRSGTPRTDITPDSKLRALCRQLETENKSVQSHQFSAQWYSVNQMLPVGEALLAWTRHGCTTVRVGSHTGSEWLISPDIKPRTSPDMWRELPRP